MGRIFHDIKTENNKKQEKNLIVIPDFFGKNPFDYIVAEILLNHVINNRNDPVITYGELAKKIDSDFNPHNLGRYLGNISDVCKENGLPLISGIVVNKDTGLPGEGFFDYYYNGIPMKKWMDVFEECKYAVINCKYWQDFLDSVI